MSIPMNSLWRGCAANFPQLVNEEDEHATQNLVESVYYFNCHIADPPLADIEFRSSSGEEDILRHVFQEVIQNGFRERSQEDTSDELYFNLERYINASGRPLDSRRPATHTIISNTLNGSWYPTVPETLNEVYCYEIYAPGGIWVRETLGGLYEYKGQDKVCFVAGIVVGVALVKLQANLSKIMS